jgi:hypothetical protein
MAEHGNEVHDLAVAQIAKSLLTFNDGEVYPGARHPTWATFTNAPVRQVPVEHRWAGLLWPDILVVDTARSHLPRLIAEVETKETLTEESVDRWALEMEECPLLYLFVPEGTAIQAADLLLEFGSVVGIPRALYTYGVDDLWRIRLTPV